MNKRHTSALAVALLSCLVFAVSVAPGLAQGTPTINWWVLGGGGAPSSGGNVTFNDTVGQPIIGPSSGGNVSLGTGYWYGAAGPPTAVTRVARWVHSLLNLPCVCPAVCAVSLIIVAGLLLFVAKGRRHR